ncbi:alpha/beta fold hydrolase [Cyanobium sp. WAJ14-Wanaka]|uniref:alpha/beta fold hydrolase n=1 Tax=Cyanobium sp. WAJ14-Wanaka TaxID=2823725 RepID=UPI0020CCC406|nr:alpha/beta fold hydrolase [Cyanobium sp. WAJ14-Wanaka]MCP9775067.1 alpha/beta fold hydrolase [Cyanobium sp. WAJ14-Wanaka]
MASGLESGLAMEGPFQQRWPWLGPDLQTLRDSVWPACLPADRGIARSIEIGPGEELIAFEDRPWGAALSPGPPRGWVLLLHGLGGSSNRQGVRRQALALQAAGFGVWRLNLRGAGASRPLAKGTYAASCNSDLLPVLAQCRQWAGGLPLLGVGLSLGGTMLLNALAAQPDGLDGLALVSSPLDLLACASQIELPRNGLYRIWLLQRLRAQTLADPFGLTAEERQSLEAGGGPRTIRGFDAAITAPRWGHRSVEAYYQAASPLAWLPERAPDLPPTILIHAADDPWVPVAGALQLRQAVEQAVEQFGPINFEVLISAQGGHNGFHGRKGRTGRSGRNPDGFKASWSDGLVRSWCLQRSSGGRLGRAAA